jgi:hypothetical protein
MANLGFDLGPDQTGGPATQISSLEPSRRPSTDDTQSHDGLLSRNTAEDNSTRRPGDSVPYAPPVLHEVLAENPTHATNSPLG